METTTHIPGTTFDKARNKWKAQLRIAGKLKSLGNFATQLEAAAAVERARAAPEQVIAASQPIERLASSESALIKHNLAKRYVYQSNELLEVLLRHPLKQEKYEYRLFIRMLQCLHNRDQVLNTIRIPIRTFIPSLDGDYHQSLHNAIANITQRRLYLSGIDGDPRSYKYLPLVTELGYDNSKRAVVGEFNPKFAQHFIKLNKDFTTGDVEVLMELKSTYAQRLYWLFKEWSGKFKGSPVTVTVEELREVTCGTQAYTTWSDFRRLVLKPAIEELEDKELEIHYEEKYEARNVARLTFKVTQKKLITAEQEAESERVSDKVVEVVALKPTPTPAQMRVNKDEPASDSLLEGVSPKLKLAYEQMLSVDKVSKSVARKIILLIADSEAKQKILFKARYEVAGDKLSGFGNGYSRAGHIVNAMKRVGLVLDQSSAS